MRKSRRSLVSALIAFSLAAGPLACAKTQSLLGLREAQEADREPVAPGEPKFDIAMIDKIVPGVTPPEQIRDWFGEPDKRIERSDGTSEWIYNKARLRRESPAEAAQRELDEAQSRREKKAARAAQVKKLVDESVVLIKAGRRQLRRFGHWVDTNLFYPPRPRRASSQVAAEPPAPVPVVSEPIRDEPPAPEMLPSLEDQKQPVTRFDLVVTFTRDAVVDEFHYQRTAGRDFIP